MISLRLSTSRNVPSHSLFAWAIGCLLLVGSSADFVAATPITSGATLWMDGNDIDGDGVVEGAGESNIVSGSVATWVDKGATLGTTNGTQATAAQRPVFTAVAGTLNSKSALFFDGVNDRFEITSLDLQTSDVTIFTAAISENIASGNPGLVNIGGGSGTATPTLEHNQTIGQFQIWDESPGSPLATGYASAKGVTESHIGFGERRVNSPLITANGRVRVSADGSTIASSTRDLPGHTGTDAYLGNLGAGNEFHRGNIGEILVYNRVLLNPERVVVQNYLSAKWDIDLIANDRYAGDSNANGDYDEDVFGIGQEGGEVLSSGTYNTGLAIQELSGSLDDNEYVLAGHTGDANPVVNTDLGDPLLVDRWARSWFVDGTGSVSVRLTFDISEANAGGLLGNSYSLLYRPTEASDFTSVIADAFVVGDEISFDLLAGQLLDGYYTLGSSVPEPNSAVLLLAGTGLLARRRRFQSRRLARS